ncbi:hypothetical protein B0J14DRAFT_468727 [Halenospora varia]|nr:hypothetical protein B0J14DRAFT_468727 [Halenospora varia]
MNASYLRKACRPRILRPRTTLLHPNGIQWQRATFISLSGSNKDPPTTTDEFLEETDGQGRLRGRPRIPENPITRPRKPATSQADVLEALFEESLTPEDRLLTEDPHSNTSLESYKHAETLKRKLEHSHPVTDSFQFFLEHFGPNSVSGLPSSGGSLPTYIRSLAMQLLQALVAAKAKFPASQSLPTITEISSLYACLGILQSIEWTEMVLNLLETLLKMRQQEARSEDDERFLLQDLLGAWNVVCRRPERSPELPSSLSAFDELDWSKVPEISRADIIKIHRSQRFFMQKVYGAFQFLTPNVSQKRLHNNFPQAAMATYGFLKEKLPDEVTSNLASFMRALGNVLGVYGSDIVRSCSDSDETDRHGVVKTFVKNEAWPILKESLETSSSTSPVEAPLPSTPRDPRIYRGLQNALKSRDVSEVDRLWAVAQQLPVNKEGTQQLLIRRDSEDKQYTLTPALADLFLYTYMAVRRPNRAIDVWNHMAAQGLAPTLQTWNAMLTGCRKGFDRESLEAVWHRMLASSIQPDAHCWTTRIVGLIECGRIDAAMMALEDMGRSWVFAKKRELQNPDGPQMADNGKPSTETVNAAIDALMDKKLPDVAVRVLAWSTKLRIRPNATTYNTLLKNLTRMGKSREAAALLKEMEENGMHADAVTYTSIIEESLRNSAEMSNEEQLRTVSQLLGEMKSSGITPNLHSYGKIIFQLLRRPLHAHYNDRDLSVVNAVLQRMASEGLQPSTYIYTMLVIYCFQMQPPDLDGVRGLIERADADGVTDNIFWDRCLENYAKIGETASAMLLLRKVEEKRHLVGYQALLEILTALIQNDELDQARSLVRNTMEIRGPAPLVTERGYQMQHEFYNLARNAGLMDY